MKYKNVDMGVQERAEQKEEVCVKVEGGGGGGGWGGGVEGIVYE